MLGHLLLAALVFSLALSAVLLAAAAWAFCHHERERALFAALVNAWFAEGQQEMAADVVTGAERLLTESPSQTSGAPGYPVEQD